MTVPEGTTDPGAANCTVAVSVATCPEELFATELFERQHKRLTLKVDGERLVAHARRLIALNDEVWGAMSAPSYAGEVRFGVPTDIVGSFIPPILKRFDRAWPRVLVALRCSTTPQLLAALRRGEIDLTLTTERACHSQAISRFLTFCGVT